MKRQSKRCLALDKVTVGRLIDAALSRPRGGLDAPLPSRNQCMTPPVPAPSVAGNCGG